MSIPLWIEELTMDAQKAITFRDGPKSAGLLPFLSMDPRKVLMLIELATKYPPPDALAQAQARETSLKEEVEELERDNFDLQYECNHLEDKVDELEREVERLGHVVEEVENERDRADRA